MATSADYIAFVCGQLNGVGAVRARKMFGEYMIYVNDKPLLLVCDNTVFVKIVPELAQIMAGAERGLPYDGGKTHYILDIENLETVRMVLAILDSRTPVPGPRKKKKRAE